MYTKYAISFLIICGENYRLFYNFKRRFEYVLKIKNSPNADIYIKYRLNNILITINKKFNIEFLIFFEY